MGQVISFNTIGASVIAVLIQLLCGFSDCTLCSAMMMMMMMMMMVVVPLVCVCLKMWYVYHQMAILISKNEPVNQWILG